MKNTGDQDLCYFNFACSYKAFGITDFNHFFSNGAYIIFAIVFVAISTIKNRTIVVRANNCNQVANFSNFFLWLSLLLCQGNKRFKILKIRKIIKN